MPHLSSYEMEKRIHNAKNIVELKKELITILNEVIWAINELDSVAWECRMSE